jgi:y4mF family transcriptional regulator
MQLSEFVKERRKTAGLTQEEFADRAGVALTVIRKIEQGKTNLNLDKVNHVLSMFGHIMTPISYEELVNVIINDGEQEYNNQEIKGNKKLLLIRNSVMYLGGFASLLIDIINENGTIYITTDKSFSSGSGDLKGVSKDLYNRFLERRP